MANNPMVILPGGGFGESDTESTKLKDSKIQRSCSVKEKALLSVRGRSEEQWMTGK